MFHDIAGYRNDSSSCHRSGSNNMECRPNHAIRINVASRNLETSWKTYSHGKESCQFRTHWVAIVCLLNLLVMQFWPTLQLEPPKGLGVKLSCQMPLSKGICFSLSSGCCIDHVSFLSIFRRCFFEGPGPPKMASLALEKIASIARWSTWLPCKDKATCGTWSRPGHLGMGPQRRSNAF